MLEFGELVFSHAWCCQSSCLLNTRDVGCHVAGQHPYLGCLVIGCRGALGGLCGQRGLSFEILLGLVALRRIVLPCKTLSGHWEHSQRHAAAAVASNHSGGLRPWVVGYRSRLVAVN